MSEKRRDNKGRILKTGEAQRKDLTYQYRYTDIDGVRRTVYAPTLSELREKEKVIQGLLEKNIAISSGNMSLFELLNEFMTMKRNIRPTTKTSYESIIRRIGKENIASMHIRSIKPIHAKKWMIELFERNYAFGTIKYYHSVLKSAFDMAIENDYLVKNPFAFKLDFIMDNTEKKCALSESQQEAFLKFLRNDACYSKHYDVCVFLIETGIRAGELCGLTLNDVDLENRCININHQIIRTKNKSLYIAPPKSKAGYRTIPLTPRAFDCLKNIIRNRPKIKIEPFIDGHTGFLLVTRQGNPYFSALIDHLFTSMRKAYTAQNIQLPKITPHVLRHTFCTNMVNRGMIPKHVQYLMGHSNIEVTMNIYTDVDAMQVVSSMKRLSLL